MNRRTPEQQMKSFYSVFSASGTFVAATLFAEDAAAIAAANGHGATIYSPGGKRVWREGREIISGRDTEKAANLIRANMHAE